MVAVAVAVTVVGGFVWRDHLQGLAGPGDRGAPRGDRHRDGFRPPRDEAFREPFGAPDGEHRSEGRDGRGGEWFSTRGLGGFVEAGMPILVFGGLVIGADQLLRVRRRRRQRTP